jgi:hypothetical protein
VNLLDRDLTVVAVGAVALVTYALHGLHGYLSRDLGLYAYAGQQVAEGVPPYVGVLNRAGPLAHALPGVGALLARITGLDDVVTMRALFLVLATLTVCVVYLLARALFASRLAGLVGAATFLTFQGFIHYATSGPREKTPMTLFVACALWAVAARRWFTAGVFVSLATLCLQIGFFAPFAATVAGALLLASGERVRALGRVALGGCVPPAVLAVWFAATGSLGVAVDAFLVINLRYTEADPPSRDLALLWQDAQDAYGPSLWLLVGGLAALLARALTALRPSVRRDDPSVLVLAAFAVGALSGMLWNLRDYDAWPDLFPLLPFAAVGVAGLVPLAERHLALSVVTGVVTVGVVSAVAVAGHWSWTTRDDDLVRQRAAVAEVLRQLPPGAEVASLEAPQPLVLTQRANWSRHQMLRGGLEDQLEDTWPGGREGFVRDLLAERPELIAVGAITWAPWRAGIETAYTCIGTGPGWYWYAPSSLPADQRADLERAAASWSSVPCRPPVTAADLR